MNEPSGEAVSHNSPNPNPEPDPLLEPGTFIDGDSNDPAAANHSDPPPTGSPKSKVEERTRPLSDFGTETVADTPPQPRRKKRGATEEPASATPTGMTETERPDWLPDGWRLDVRVRISGATAGTTDRYYIEPTHGHRFRSKKEALHYLQTGEKMKQTGEKTKSTGEKTKPTGEKTKSTGEKTKSTGEKTKATGEKSKKRANSDDPDSATPSTGPKEKKEKKSETKAKKPVPIKFDFNQPPETVSWTLTDIAADLWDPSVSDQKVLESTKKDWAAVFDQICEIQSKNNDDF